MSPSEPTGHFKQAETLREVAEVGRQAVEESQKTQAAVQQAILSFLDELLRRTAAPPKPDPERDG
jgi:hypothetical protein